MTGQVALITIDNGRDHTRPNTFGPRGLAELGETIDAAIAADPAAIAVTGKPFVFAAGADLSGLGFPDLAAARAMGALGQDVFGKLRRSPIPTFAFVNGVALGGGLELALHCHYRTLASNAAMVAFPEVFLGILPGWGGTQLLPRIAGPENAVTVIIENPLSQNRMLKPVDAARLGRRRRRARRRRPPRAVAALAGRRPRRPHRRRTARPPPRTSGRPPSPAAARSSPPGRRTPPLPPAGRWT